MNWKKIGKALVYPHIAVMIILVPVSVLCLVYSMVALGTESIASIVSYVLSAYTLTVWCFKIPYLIKLFKKFKNENKYLKLLRENPALKVNVSLYGNMIWNLSYGAFHLGLGFWHRSFWFYSLAGYYILLGVMRFSLVRHTRRYKAGEEMLKELKKFRFLGIVFLVINLYLALIIFFMVYWNRTFNHHEITTIALSAFTFTSLTIAIVNTVKYRKYQSPVYSASKMISLTSAAVSMLILEATMLTTFGGEEMDLLTRRIMLGASGVGVSVFIIGMAVFMIAVGTKNIKKLKEKRNG